MPKPLPSDVSAFLWGADVSAFEAEGDDWLTGLLPAEEALLGRVAEKRRREFTAGRNCARGALSKLGVSPTPILRGPSREPIWPSGVIGSITHCDCFCGAVVAWDSQVRALGIDAEPNLSLPTGTTRQILCETERQYGSGDVHSEARWDRLIFSAKESIFKAWFPLTGERLGFADVSLEVDWVAQHFTPRYAPPKVLALNMIGRFCVRNETIISAVTIPRTYRGNRVTG